MLRRPDHVVRRRDDERGVADRRGVVAQGAEWTDLGHGTSRNGTSPAALGTGPSYDSVRSAAVDRATFGGCKASLLRPGSSRSPGGVSLIRRPLAPRRSQRTQAAARSVVVFGLLAAALGVLAGPVAAADAPTMTARVLVGGHARIGSWVAISVHLHNDGPAVSGELRVASGTQGETRFGTAVDLPTQSDKTYVLYAQPPTFGTQLDVLLVEGDRTIASVKARFTSHEASQLDRRRDRRASGTDRRRSGPAPELRPGRAAGREPRAGGPPGAARGLECDRPDHLAGHRRQPPDDGADRRPPRLDGGRWPARDRRRHRRSEVAGGLPGRAVALPPRRHDRRPAGEPGRAARRTPGRSDHPARPCRAS